MDGQMVDRFPEFYGNNDPDFRCPPGKLRATATQKNDFTRTPK